MKKNTAILSTAGGMIGLLAGRKLSGLGMFAKGVYELEKHWQKDNDFQGSLEQRWQRAIDFYNQTHSDPVNRILHIVGIPMIVGGSIGLITFPSYRPMWMASAGIFTGGWILNFIGHGIFEKNKPAFADDPLAFIAGPVWDLKQVTKSKDSRSFEGKLADIGCEDQLPSFN